MSKQTRIEKQQARVDAFILARAKELQKLIDAQKATALKLAKRQADARDDWWCTIPQGMIPLISAARSELNQSQLDGPNGEQSGAPDLEE
jgi:hypothetical protein